MSQKLINRSPDLKRLRDEGYEVEIRHGHLLVSSVPYVNAAKQIKLGTLVSELSLAGEVTVKPGTHVVYFKGEFPCTQGGHPIEQIRHVTAKKTLASGIEVDHSFSNKPSDGYSDYYAKMTQYIMMISHPAKALDNDVDARTFRPVEDSAEESVFRYIDTASSRAGIQAISEKLSSQRVAIVGLGGTGSYVLDFVAKTPVREIHLFDADEFQTHNAFRAPGATSFEDLCKRKKKVDHFAGIYSRMRAGVVAHPQRISIETVLVLTEFDFVFLCVDDGPCKRIVFDSLTSSGTGIIDAGMDVMAVEQELLGTCRVTASTKNKNDHIASRVSMAENIEGGAYSSNIQIVELNALNACIAVVKWKQLSGFYQDLEHEHHLTYSTNCALLDTGDKYHED